MRSLARCIFRNNPHAVVVHDPRAGDNAARAKPGLRIAPSVEEAAADADVLLVLTDWEELRAIDPVALAGVVRTTCVVDGRLALDADKWRAAGWDVHALGRGGE